MPELDETHTSKRLQRRIAELEAGVEIAKRDIYAVLTMQQQHELESALSAQQTLKKQYRARTDEEKRALGWKSIREVRVEVLKRALGQAEANQRQAWKKKQHDADVRGATIYLDAFFQAREAGKSTHSAHTWANNALTRAGLSRWDGRTTGVESGNAKTAKELEEIILQRARLEMTKEELAQLEWLEVHAKEVKASRRDR